MLAPLLLALAGCGDEDRGGATSGSAPSAARAPREVAVLSASAAGGRTGEPVRLDEAGLAALTADLGRGLPEEIRDVVARTDVPTGQVLLGAVVAVDCETPTAVKVEDDADGLRLVPVMPARRTPVQCLLPVTSVGIVLVDAESASTL